MSPFRKTIHAAEHEQLRLIFRQQRERLGLTQRELASRMGVIYSLIGKIETGDRRLDVIEFMDYCKVLELDSCEVLQAIRRSRN